MVFQRIFSETTVLLPFLNGVFADNPDLKVGQLTYITVEPREPRATVGQWRMIFDIWATDEHGENYLVKIQRYFRHFQTGRFQYYAARAFCDTVEKKNTSNGKRNTVLSRPMQNFSQVSQELSSS